VAFRTGPVLHDRVHKFPSVLSSAEQANRLENLTTLCPTCHRRAKPPCAHAAAWQAFLSSSGIYPLIRDVTADLGVHADPQSPLSDGQPTVVIYDRVPAGIGLSQRLCELHTELIQRAYEVVDACPCSDGCPACVGPGGESGLAVSKRQRQSWMCWQNKSNLDSGNERW
jgi:DEAD/DEAH box helicase domain-containing protein